jgi:ankyrin repeat protein
VNEAQRMHLRLHEALRASDLEGVRYALGNPVDFANARDAYLNIPVLSHAIGLASIAFVRILLEAGADPNYGDHAGFPSLFCALDADTDRLALLALLLEFGADVEQRGINDYTPLHHAAARNDAAAIEVLLAHGADPDARTRIDDRETPLEEALRFGWNDAVRVLRAHQR